MAVRKKKKYYKQKKRTKKISLRSAIKNRIAREEVLLSIIWVAVLVMSGIILEGTAYATYVLVLILVGMIGSLIVVNYNK
ncbi:MAG: hypothetical protein U9Q69_02975 [Nanoarchaeota archaeon]|nr:hypothetical protein [Nanoarchaeota archaeon]